MNELEWLHMGKREEGVMVGSAGAGLLSKCSRNEMDGFMIFMGNKTVRVGRIGVEKLTTDYGTETPWLYIK